eukprot:3825004-Pleurochrysis_carterae.AAC.1
MAVRIATEKSTIERRCRAKERERSYCRNKHDKKRLKGEQDVKINKIASQGVQVCEKKVKQGEVQRMLAQNKAKQRRQKGASERARESKRNIAQEEQYTASRLRRSSRQGPEQEIIRT